MRDTKKKGITAKAVADDLDRAADTHPAWFTARARVATAAEREVLWPQMVGLFPLYATANEANAPAQSSAVRSTTGRRTRRRRIG